MIIRISKEYADNPAEYPGSGPVFCQEFIIPQQSRSDIGRLAIESVVKYRFHGLARLKISNESLYQIEISG